MNLATIPLFPVYSHCIVLTLTLYKKKKFLQNEAKIVFFIRMLKSSGTQITKIACLALTKGWGGQGSK